MFDFEKMVRDAVVGSRLDLAEAVRGVVREELLAASRMDPDTLLTIEQAAARLGMSVAGLRKAVQRGQVAVHRLGRRVRLRAGDLGRSRAR